MNSPQQQNVAPSKYVAHQEHQQPEVPLTFMPKGHRALAIPQAPYEPCVSPMRFGLPLQEPPTITMQPMPTTNPDYSAPSPFRSLTDRQFPSVQVPLPQAARREGKQPCSGYRQPSSHSFQTDSFLPNANATVDGQIRNGEFIRQHMLHGGRSASVLRREAARLSTEGDNLRWEVDCSATTEMELRRRVDEKRPTTDHHQDRGRRLGQSNEHRCRRSLSPRRRDRGCARLASRYLSPPRHDGRGRHFDSRNLQHSARSSRGDHLQSPSSRWSTSPSRPPSSCQPTPTMSEHADGRHLSTFAPPSAASSAGQQLAPFASTSPVVHGPEVAFDSAEEWDDDDFEDIEGYDAKKGKKRAFNVRNRAMNKRSRDTMRAKYAPRGIDRTHPSLPCRPAPQWLPGQVPEVPLNSALDPPQVPGAKREAYMDIWPLSTDASLADKWSDYVPLNNAQCQDLLRSARAFDSGAAQRVRDLIHQYDTMHELCALGYLHKIKEVWRDPHRKCDPHIASLPRFGRYDQRNQRHHVNDGVARAANRGQRPTSRR